MPHIHTEWYLHHMIFVCGSLEGPQGFGTWSTLPEEATNYTRGLGYCIFSFYSVEIYARENLGEP